MKSFLLSIVVFTALFVPQFTQAAEFGVGQEYFLKQGDSIQADLYALGGTATLVGDVEGDVFLGGGNVFVGNTVSSNVNLIGGTVDVIGEVGRSLRIVSGKTIVRGTVGKDLVVASGDLQVLQKSVISGDALLAAGNVVLDGEVNGDLRGVAGSLILNGIVKGDVHITADSIVVGPNARVDGEFVYSSSKQATIAPSAVIVGEQTFTQVDTRSRAERLIPTLWGTWIVIKFIVLLVSALVIQGIFRSISNTLVNTALTDPKWSIVRGFLILVATPVALILILLTFIGIPFVVLGFSAYMLFLGLAYLFGPIVLGALIYKLSQKEHVAVINWKSIVVGVFAFMILTPLGWVGTTLQSILFLLTLGAIYHVLFERFIRAREY